MVVIGTAITVGAIRRGRLHLSIAAAILSTVLGAAVMNLSGAHAAPRETAVLPPPALGSPANRLIPTDLPPVLSQGDVVAYQRIFAAQAGGDWALADKLIGELRDPRLLGYVLAERYLSPRYKPGPAELTAWLRNHGDHVDAGRIHALALKHKGLGPVPAPVAAAPLTGSLPGEDDAGWHSTAPRTAPKVVATKPAAKGGKKPAAAPHAEPAGAEPVQDASAGARHNPHAAWLAGLAAWRAGKHELAIKNFEAVATSPASSSFNASAGAFWAARGHLVTRKPQLYVRWMSRAAESPYTFYGMLGRRALGQDINIDWSLPALGKDELQRLEAFPGALRAIALVQLGDRVRAEDELRRVFPKLPVPLQPAALTIAERGGMPGLAMRIAGRLLNSAGQRYDAGLYPVPPWTPPGGYTLNRALLFSLARIESGFNPNARNPSGAAGLMQLMPATARNMGRGIPGVENVFDPHANMALGQRYVDQLLKHERVKGNLLSLVAAYNVGPGNLSPTPNEDPLLLIESMTSAETRSLIQRVLTNFWIYQLRLGQPTDSLDAIAQGEMPVYTGTRGGDTALAERYGRN